MQTSENVQQQIEMKAYQIWEAEGYPDNKAIDHWFQAEKELGVKKIRGKGLALVKSMVKKSAKSSAKA